MNKLIFIGILGMFALGSCHHNHDAHDHDAIEHNHEAEGHDHEAEGEEHAGHNHEAEAAVTHSEEAHSDEIILPKAKAEAAGVKVNTIQPAPFQQVIKTSGQVMAAQGEESTAVATVAGVVSLRSNIVEGSTVSRGTSLANISSHNIAEGDPVQRARVAYETAKKEYERMEALRPQRIVSEKDFAQARQNYENARISYEALAQNHSDKGQSIPSPMAGYVKNILVKEGDYVNIGQPLMSITQNRRLFLRAEVSEKYYPYLSSITSANFRTSAGSRVYELQQLNGKLLSYGKSAGDSSYYVPVTFEFDNKGDIIPGSFVEVYLLSSPMENVISVPRTALTEEQGIYFVYLQLDEEGYLKQEVTIGADNGQSVQILTGVKAGDRVVTEGAYQVRLASASNAIPAHSHEH